MTVRGAIIALHGLVAAGFLSASRLIDGEWSEAFLGYGLAALLLLPCALFMHRHDD
jgi:hypothetical protein